jgi:hypothetical protein
MLLAGIQNQLLGSEGNKLPFYFEWHCQFFQGILVFTGRSGVKIQRGVSRFCFFQYLPLLINKNVYIWI